MEKVEKIKFEISYFKADGFILQSPIAWSYPKVEKIRTFFSLVGLQHTISVGFFTIGYYHKHNLTEKELMSLAKLLEEILNEEIENTDESANKNNGNSSGTRNSKIRR